MAASAIKVFPRIEAALVIARFRKDRPALTIEGAMWPADSFTHCRLNDGSVTTEEEQAYKPPAAESEAAPAAATAA